MRYIICEREYLTYDYRLNQANGRFRTNPKNRTNPGKKIKANQRKESTHVKLFSLIGRFPEIVIAIASLRKSVVSSEFDVFLKNQNFELAESANNSSPAKL